jgi:[acyl-carrier-protein] S-malonyltransferase
MPYCIIFPGQGTQFVGMADGLDLNGMPDGLVSLMMNGPEDELNITYNAQPAVLGVSISIWKNSGLDAPSMVMGHSLGEYTALVACGAVSLSDAIGLVTKRGELMQACPSGSMAAVMGLSEGELSDAIAPFGDIWIANINGAGQIVISGKREAVGTAVAALKEKKARVVPLNVSVASHCPLMSQAGEKLSVLLNDIEIKEPKCDVIFNVTAEEERNPESIRNLLTRQLTSPVRWEQSIKRAADLGIDTFIEIGPKSVLAPLVRKTIPGINIETRTLK